MEREVMEYDVVIVGGGPSGLSAAIKLAQLAKENNKPLEGKYKRVYHSEDGTKMTWYYDTNRTTNGPVKVDISYPKDYDFRTFEEKLHQRNSETDKLKNLSVNDFENNNDFCILNNIYK